MLLQSFDRISHSCATANFILTRPTWPGTFHFPRCTWSGQATHPLVNRYNTSTHTFHLLSPQRCPPVEFTERFQVYLIAANHISNCRITQKHPGMIFIWCETREPQLYSHNAAVPTGCAAGTYELRARICTISVLYQMWIRPLQFNYVLPHRSKYFVILFKI